jgi:hypothetical protein
VSGRWAASRTRGAGEGGFPRGGGEGEDRQVEEGDTVVMRKETRRTAGSSRRRRAGSCPPHNARRVLSILNQKHSWFYKNRKNKKMVDFYYEI